MCVMIRCWHCEAEVLEDAIEYESVLVPRTAERGGPLYLYRCAGCGVDSVVERNAAGERLLSPPHLAGVRSSTVRGKAVWAARKWAAEHRDERREFLSRPGPARPEIEPPPPGREPPPPPESDPEEAPPPGVDLSDASTVLEAYAVLGLPLSAKADDVKRRYRQLSKRCHPDLVAEMDDEIRRVAEERFREITEAYELIRDPKRSPGATW